MIISLICTSIEKNKNLLNLIDSINPAKNIISIIYVNQGVYENQEDILGLKKLHKNISFIFVPGKSLISLSKARNIGMEYVPKESDYVGFPDDDCWYPKDFFTRLSVLFEKNNEDFLSLSVYDPFLKKSLGFRGKIFGRRKINYSNLFIYPISVGIFIRYKCLPRDIRFNELVGAGTKIGSGEETIFIADLLRSKLKGAFDSSLSIYHLHDNNVEINLQKIFHYSLGFGIVARFISEEYSKTANLNYLIFILANCIPSFSTKRNLKKIYRVKGMLRGYFSDGYKACK